MAESMLNKWDYSRVGSVCYSDRNQESYIKSANFLGDSCEDWGCGTAWAKKYFTTYKGIDGSPHPNVDEVADLVYYTSDTDNILMRQVLELNSEWRQILENVKKSFKKKFCLVVFSPMAEKTSVIYTSDALKYDGSLKGGNINILSFSKQDILDYFPEKEGYKVTEETVKTDQGYGYDWILYVEKIIS